MDRDEFLDQSARILINLSIEEKTASAAINLNADIQF
jgi:hypothetical protein